MLEWLKRHAWRACKRETVSRVRIPHSLRSKKVFMKTLFFTNVVLLVICAFFFLGCPYGSEVPIDSTPEAPIIKDLIGTWAESDSASKRYVIKSENDFVYTIEEFQKDSKSGKYDQVTAYSAYLSNINSTFFLNVKEKEGSNNIFYTSNYYFYKLQVFKDSVILTPVTEYIRETFSNSVDLKSYFNANMNNSYFYAQDQKYFRIVQ